MARTTSQKKRIILLITMILLFIVGQLFFFAPAANAKNCFCYYESDSDQYCKSSGTQTTEAYCEASCQALYGNDYSFTIFSADPTDEVSDQDTCTTNTEPTTTTATATTPEVEPIVPNLSIDIPGLNFSGILDNNGVLQIDYLGEYIAAAYNYLIGIGTIIAIVFIMIGGLQYALGGISPDQMGKAKTRIRNAIMGLILLLATYLILYIVNPQLSSLPAIEIEQIDYDDL